MKGNSMDIVKTNAVEIILAPIPEAEAKINEYLAQGRNKTVIQADINVAELGG
jgi:hypothetical protein